jgi:NAD(P)-dependent dehydrogenase (short-subunit alcohol dehydrogenase family)
MKTRATGRELFIIVTTSVAAFYGGGTGSGYSPSKSAQQRIVESLNAEYAEHGVRAFGVHPCNAATEMVAGKVSQEFADESLDEDPLLPGQFFVWLVATKEAQKLQGRYTNATWDGALHFWCLQGLTLVPSGRVAGRHSRRKVG